MEKLIEHSDRKEKRFVDNNEMYLDVIGQPRGIPFVFKARDEVVAGIQSIIPWMTSNKNLEWKNYIYHNQQRLLNYSIEGCEIYGAELHANTKMTIQNRKALDWMMARQGGICHMFGEECCTYIPEHTTYIQFSKWFHNIHIHSYLIFIFIH